jgi:hypothetical protein
LYDKVCSTLCLHTRAARIVFFISLLSIMTVTVIAALYLYEPQAMVPPPAVQAFDAAYLQQVYHNEYGREEGERLFAFTAAAARFGDELMQEYVFLRSEGRREGGTLTAPQARSLMANHRLEWERESTTLLAAGHPYIKALAEDIDQAQQLALDGLNRPTPFLNQRLFTARGIYHDLHNVLLTSRSNKYFGGTRFGRLVEEDGRSQGRE